MAKFKAGDKVRCVQGVAGFDGRTGLREGATYTVTGIDEAGGVDVGVWPDGWFPHRFVAVEDATPAPISGLPTDSATRKNLPITTGVFDYFPLAVAYVALVSKVANDQHNPGQPMHWAREKSTDHPDCMARHLMERGTVDTDRLRHSGKLAWRALANLQRELEDAQSRGEKVFELD